MQPFNAYRRQLSALHKLIMVHPRTPWEGLNQYDTVLVDGHKALLAPNIVAAPASTSR
ncbi:hypothetical protein [Streptomyces viridochromogenes]|uniref:hypothetical protein n=1 Tax=Streptomyces viridochromogenes TaxID=1938 RepID=UPI000A44F958|nr:hypothetical protein [Streptomyces viridochromogenes]